MREIGKEDASFKCVGSQTHYSSFDDEILHCQWDSNTMHSYFILSRFGEKNTKNERKNCKEP